MKLRIFAVMLAFTISHQALAQDAFAFFRGETFPPPRSAPAAWLNELHKADGLLNSSIAVATFLPNTRLAWHNHPGLIHTIVALEDSDVLEASTPFLDDVIRLKDNYGREGTNKV